MPATAIYFRPSGRDHGLLRAIKDHAKREDMSLSAYVRKVLLAHIATLNAEKK